MGLPVTGAAARRPALPRRNLPILHLSPHLAAALALILLPEILLLAADHRLVGSTFWRQLAWQYGGFWAGLLHGWRPNYAAQPATMFVTYVFLHAGPIHAIGNALALLVLGRRAEERAGAANLWLVLGAATLTGALAFGLVSRSPAPMVGASGAVFGLAGALVVWNARTEGRIWARVLLGTAALVAINLLSWVLMAGQLAWETHLGGMMGGMAVASFRPLPER